MSWKGELDDTLHCTICLSVFDDPRSLPCLHTFCAACLKSDILNRTRECHGSYQCPVCRKPVGMYPGIDGDFMQRFPENFHLKKMIDIAGKIEITSNGTCPTHEKEIQNYCMKCDIGICIQCLKTTCPTHLDDIFDTDQMKDHVKKKIHSFKKLASDVTKRAKQSRDISEQTILSMNSVSAEIRDFGNKLMQLVLKHRNECLHKAQTLFAADLSRRQCYREDICRSIAPLLNIIKERENSIQKADLKDLILLYTKLQEVDMESIEKRCHAGEQERPLEVSFQPNMSLIEGIATLCKSFGRINGNTKVSEFSLVRGAGSPGFGVSGLSLTSSGDMLCIDELGLRKYDKAGTMLHDYAKELRKLDNGKTLSLFGCVTSLADCDQNVESILASDRNGSIVKLTSNGFQISTPLPFHPIAIARNSKSQVVVTSDAPDPPCVRIFSEDGEQLHISSGKSIKFKKPWNLAVNSKDFIIVSDWEINTVFLLSNIGGLIKTYQPRSRDEALNCPRGVAVHGQDSVYVCDQANNRVVLLTADLEFSREVLNEKDGLTAPLSLDFDRQGNIVIGERNDTVKIFKLHHPDRSVKAEDTVPQRSTAPPKAKETVSQHVTAPPKAKETVPQHLTAPPKAKEAVPQYSTAPSKAFRVVKKPIKILPNKVP